MLINSMSNYDKISLKKKKIIKIQEKPILKKNVKIISNFQKLQKFLIKICQLIRKILPHALL